MKKKLSGDDIRDSFIKFFHEKGHTQVPSASIVPGGDQTLLFTNAGMVQFKEVFLGTDKRTYTRAVDSQKCMRVSGKHNDLDEVGRDDTHHTFFEMLGNWSFGDYYKKEAIAWAWELLTREWGIPKDRLWATCFEDEKGEIDRDDEAAQYWRQQPGIDPSHVLFFGRKENFWEMAETGPCGPCSEIHYDRGIEFCDKQDVPGHVCEVNGDCKRFLELWNLVFIQYNRLGANSLEPLPAKHVDTGMGFERVASVLQDVDSNYKIDLLASSMDMIQELTGDDDTAREKNLTPYRVITDHARAAAFLIADRVIPGNTGRNYVCRMIIRRAARFGGKIGLNQPFLAEVARSVIQNYGIFYPELVKNQNAILDNVTREEKRFQRTLESGLAKLDNLLSNLAECKELLLPGDQAFDLYATYGLPLEITRDIAREQNLEVDETGFREAMQEHRLASGAGEAFGIMSGEDVDIYRQVLSDLQRQGKLGEDGVSYDPYRKLEFEAPILALFKNGMTVDESAPGDKVEVVLPETCFYIESGGQVSDTGILDSLAAPIWQIRIDEMRKPTAGMILHVGEVVLGNPRVGDECIARVDAQRRRDIMRNHTATHLLHSELHAVLGDHARQAGSRVAPDHLRFDFTHPEAISPKQLERIEAGVNRNILNSHSLNFSLKPLQQAMNEGAMALFGEKYSQIVRTITIGEKKPFSYELCGGTHVGETGDIGVFIITSEGSAAAGIRRIVAVTGRGAYELIQRRFRVLKETAMMLNTSPEEVPGKTQTLMKDLGDERKRNAELQRAKILVEYQQKEKTEIPKVRGITVLQHDSPEADSYTLLLMGDSFRKTYPEGFIILSGSQDNIAVTTDELVERGINLKEWVKDIPPKYGGRGGGKPNLVHFGGIDRPDLTLILSSSTAWIEEHLKDKD